VSTRGGGWC